MDAADLGGDGLRDVLGCVEWSNYVFYRHGAIEIKHRPTYELSTPGHR